MKIQYCRKKLDIAITLFIAYFFILSMSFYYLKCSSQLESYVMLTVSMIIAIVGYYTNATVTLMTVIIEELGYGSYKLYRSSVGGVPIEGTVYYWIVVIVLTAVISSFLGKYIAEIQKSISKLEEDNKSLIIIDSLIGIGNSAAFFSELPIYMSLSRRYDLPIAVMLVRFKYSTKLKNIVDLDFFKEIIMKCCNGLKNSLTFEDRKYILEDEDTFAFILTSKKDGCEIVKGTFRDNLDKICVDKHDIFNKIELEIQVGYYMYNDSIKNGMEFLDKVESELEVHRW